jgi:hypothetical protein
MDSSAERARPILRGHVPIVKRTASGNIIGDWSNAKSAADVSTTFYVDRAQAVPVPAECRVRSEPRRFGCPDGGPMR